MQEYLLEVVSVKYLTLEIVEILVAVIAPQEALALAGQSLQLRLAEEKIAVYSPEPSLLNSNTFVLCAMAAPGTASRTSIDSLSAGSRVSLEVQPTNFVMSDVHRNSICLAQGLGVVPFASMIPSMLLDGYSLQITLVFEVAAEENVFYYERFMALSQKYLNFKFIPMVSHPHAHWPGEVGTAGTYLQVSGNTLAGYMAYVAGRASFVELVRQQWLASSHIEADIKTLVLK